MGDLGSTAAAVPIDPAAEKARALRWLDECIDYGRFPPHGAPAVIKALLAEPRLPAEPSDAALNMMHVASGHHLGGNALVATYRALYAHLTAPETKTVEVWRVEWALGDFPMCHQHLSEADARASAKLIAQENHRTCIRVTGPFKQEVPA